jgi:signal transduction histidine kinase
MNSWKGRSAARPGVIARASDGRGTLSSELANALDRVRDAARCAAHADTHERRALELKDVIAEARLALALSVSLQANANGEPTLLGTSSHPPPSSDWLVRSVVHDLNNMLLVIQNCAEVMRQQPSLVPREAGVVQDAVAQATRLIAKLLPPDSTVGRLPATDLSQAVLRFEGVIRSLVGAEVTVVTRLAPGLPPARCDEMAVGRLLSNLATNARDAMPHGGTLTLETHTELRAAPDELDAEVTEYVVLAVSDTGRGMDSETRDRAFEPFFTTKPTGKGSGVGLATVREIVHAAAGFVELDSRLETGTSVRVFLRCFGPRR